MSTLITSKAQASSSISKFQVPKRMIQVLKFLIVGGITISLSFLNLWAGLGFIVAACLYLSKDFIAFIIYILQLDFDLTKDIFKDLEPM